MNSDNRLLIWGASFALALSTCICWGWGPQIRNEFFVIMGNRNETGGWYGFWSAFGGATRTVEYLVLGAVVYVHHTCQFSKGCLRLGKYPAADGLFKLCHKHHPDLGGSRPGRDLIRRLHRERA